MDFRKAKYKDVKVIFDWANDPVTREQSYTNSEILYEDHKKWFDRKLKDNNSLLLLFFDENTKIGIVRFDLNNDHWIVSINIAPSQRGKGYSIEMLKSSKKYLREHDIKPVYAYIKKNNLPSQKAFERAGYNLEKQIVYKGTESYLYIWR